MRTRILLTTLMAATTVAAVPAVSGPDCVADEMGLPAGSDGCPLWASDLTLAPSYAGFISDGAIFSAATPVSTTPDGATTIVTRPVEGADGQHDWATSAVATSTGAVQWESTLAVARYDVPITVAHAPGLALVTGVVDYPDTPNTLYVNVCGPYDESLPATVAYDVATGAERWRHIGTEQGVSFGSAVSPDGTVLYTTGAVHEPGTDECDLDVRVEALDVATGTVLWTATHTVSGTGTDRALTIQTTPTGLVVSGRATAGARAPGEVFALGLDATDGALRWSRLVAPTPHSDDVTSTALSPDGTTLYLAGSGATGVGSLFANTAVGGTVLLPDSDYVVSALDTATGDVRWMTRYDGGTPGPDVGLGLAVSPDGNQIVVTGQVAGTSDVELDIATVAFAAQDGAVRWVHTVADPGHNVEIGEDIAIAPDGTIVVVGQLGRSGTGSPAIVLWLAPDGTELRSSRVDLEVTRGEYASHVTLAPTLDRILVAGRAVDEIGAGTPLPDSLRPTGPDTFRLTSFALSTD